MYWASYAEDGVYWASYAADAPSARASYELSQEECLAERPAGRIPLGGHEWSECLLPSSSFLGDGVVSRTVLSSGHPRDTPNRSSLGDGVVSRTALSS